MSVASKDPRSLAVPGNAWITDSRAYNLIWLGRWLERALGLVHALEAAARATGEDTAFVDECGIIARAWGVPGEPADLPRFFAECLGFARDDATHVGPLELMQKLNALVTDLPGIWTSVGDRTETLSAMETLAERLNEIAAEIEDRWFHRMG